MPGDGAVRDVQKKARPQRVTRKNLDIANI
jgi:hypothetical protein